MPDSRDHKRQLRNSAPLPFKPEEEGAPPPEPEEPSSAPAKKPHANRYECDYCRKDITVSVRIRCAECADFDLCVECFSMGVEVLTHKNDHAYRVIEHISEPIFDRDWGADEERLLLEGILVFGFGNWQDIAEYVATKSRQKCQAHYNAVYLSGSTAPLPNMDAPLIDFKDYRKEDPASVAVDRRLSILNVPLEISSGESKSGTPAKPVPVVSTQKSQDTSLARMIGFVPKRGDFDTEHDNEAEKYLSDMEFLPEDTPEERRLKLDVIAIYNRTLDERQRRKDFIIDRELLLPCTRKRTREEREICQNMACFARFHTKEEHNNFIQGLLNEHRLRKRIEQLQEHRLMGIRTLAESVQYESEKKKREVNKSLRKDKEKCDYLYSTPRTVTSVRRRRSMVDSECGEAARPVQDDLGESAPSAWNIDPSMEGYSSLSELEVRLCQRMHLFPSQFIAIKERLVIESFKRGFLDPNAPKKQLIRIDVNKTDRIFDLFVSTGWDMNTEAIAALSANDKLPS